MNEFEKKIRNKLLIRGFKEHRLTNNRGLIGATIDEVILELVKNIGVTRCSLELKDKEKISFEEWLGVEDIKMHQDGTFYISSERRYVELTFLINRYNSQNL